MAGVEEPHACGELGWHVDDLLAGGDESLGQWTTGAVGSLDGPESVGPLLHVPLHRGVPGVGGLKPSAAEEPFEGVDDLDRHRHLVGVDPDDHALRLAHLLTSSVLWHPLGRRGGQCYYELGRPLLSHASSR